jgi:hypothetical protein
MILRMCDGTEHGCQQRAVPQTGRCRRCWVGSTQNIYIAMLHSTMPATHRFLYLAFPPRTPDWSRGRSGRSHHCKPSTRKLSHPYPTREWRQVGEKVGVSGAPRSQPTFRHPWECQACLKKDLVLDQVDRILEHLIFQSCLQKGSFTTSASHLERTRALLPPAIHIQSDSGRGMNVQPPPVKQNQSAPLTEPNGGFLCPCWRTSTPIPPLQPRDSLTPAISRRLGRGSEPFQPCARDAF